MNDRIKELAERTDEWFEDHSYSRSAWNEKFSELIVRECAGLLRQREEEMWKSGCNNDNPISKTRSDECHIMADQIEEHFGVE